MWQRKQMETGRKGEGGEEHAPLVGVIEVVL